MGAKQERILKHLSHLHQLQEKAHHMRREIVPALFMRMFGDPNTKLMDIRWEKIRLDEVIQSLSSGSPNLRNYYSEQGNVLLSLSDVKEGQLTLNGSRFIHPPETLETETNKAQKHDLLISIMKDLGKTAVVTQELAKKGAYVNQQLALVRLKNMNSYFVSAFLNSFIGRMQFAKLDLRTGRLPRLSLDSIRSLEVINPPKELQDEFAGQMQHFHLQYENLFQFEDLFKWDEMIKRLTSQIKNTS